MSAEPAILVDLLRVVRGRRVVLEDLSCTVASGRVTGLLGPSGSGKTTLMRTIVGVQRVAAGTVRVLGSHAGAVELRRRVAYMTQVSSVYRDLSVRENVRYFARLHRVPSSRADELVAQVGLRDHAGQLVGNLSGGQRARVSLACALVADPEVLILDEPTVGQDPLLRQELWDDFRQRARAGATILVSSHVMDEASRCDDLLLLREGQVLAHETPDAILRLTDAPDHDTAFARLVSREVPR